eukprot:6395849-Amphidinium_carterae.2
MSKVSWSELQDQLKFASGVQRESKCEIEREDSSALSFVGAQPSLQSIIDAQGLDGARRPHMRKTRMSFAACEELTNSLLFQDF